MRLLLIEDEQRLSTTIKKGFIEDGFAVDAALDGEEGQYLAETENYDLIVLDIMLPKKDGVSICRELRQKNIITPIIMLTAKSTIEDKITGLENGADDYLTKPFSFSELRARIQALLRRSQSNLASVLKINDLELDPLKHSVSRQDKKILLTQKEFAILEYLMRHQDEVVTRTMIVEHVWDYNFESMSNIVDVFIGSLRKKIDRGYNPKLIHTLRGVGYKISTEL
ncbi:response regulator transcription factor [Patescibacteria group bacterium]|nr:response regulator transcription factor [Patescibacteria group bacterium]